VEWSSAVDPAGSSSPSAAVPSQAASPLGTPVQPASDPSLAYSAISKKSLSGVERKVVPGISGFEKDDSRTPHREELPFIFNVYAPKVFACVRQAYGKDSRDLIKWLTPPYTEFDSNSNSGQLFWISSDKQVS